jgi:thiol-disulfide isomerase/thioredoxin
MVMSKGILLAMLVFFFIALENAFPQPLASPIGPAKRPLKIGDIVPDFKLREVLNYPLSTARLSQLRGKLTILDFWASPCSGCVGLFPHMQKLQDEFHGDLKIVLVDARASLWHDDMAKVTKILLIKGTAIGEKISMPVVLNSPELYESFPYLGVPHEVWIDSAGNVLAITDAYAVTAANIQKVLAGERIHFSTKMDIDGDLTKQSLMEVLSRTPIGVESPLFSAIIYRGHLSVMGGSGVRRDELGRYTGFFLVNEQLIDIYRNIFRELMSGFSANMIVVEASHPERFSKSHAFDSMENAQWYSYDLSTGPMSMDSLLLFSQSELNNVLHTRVFRARRRVHCLILGMAPHADTVQTGDGKPNWVSDIKDSLIRVINSPIRDLVSSLNGEGFPLPIIWDSPYSGSINCNLPLDLSDRLGVIQRLKEAGFTVTEEYREEEVIVIGDR